MSQSKIYEEQKQEKAEQSSQPSSSSGAKQHAHKSVKKKSAQRTVVATGRDSLGREVHYNAAGKRVVGWPTIIATILGIACAIGLIIWISMTVS